MAVTLPTFEQYNLPRLSLPPTKVEAEPPPRPYDLLSPEKKAAVDQQVAMDLKQHELAQTPRGALGEIGTGLARGAMVELPRMVGQAMQATGKPGDLLYDIGTPVVKNADAREVNYAEDLNPENHGAVVQALSQGAAMVAPSLAPMAALPLLAAGGVPAAAGLAVAGAAGAGLFGASQYTQTYDKAIAAGKTPEEAHKLGLQTGTIEGVGETLGTMVGAKFLTGASKILPRVLGKKYTTETALAGLRDPNFAVTLAKNLGETALVETGTEMAQNYGETAVEHAAGIEKTTPWEAATAAIGPTLAMTGLLGPFGAFALRRQTNRNRVLMDAIESDKTDFNTTSRAMREIAPQLEPLIGREKMNEWRSDVLLRSNQLDAAKGIDAQQPTGPREEVPKILGLPAPDTRITSPQDAQSLWDTFASRLGNVDQRIAEAKSNEQQERLFRDIATGPLPEGVPTFSQYVEQAKAAEGEPSAAAQLTSRGLKLGYIQAVNAAIKQHGLPEPAGPTTVQGQPELPLTGGRTAEQLAAEKPPEKTFRGAAVDEASARLAAAKDEVKPAQGTAHMLGLVKPESPLIIADAGGRTSYSINQKDRMEWLDHKLPGTRKQLRAQLATMQPEELAYALREIWHSKGGEAGPVYNAKIDEAYSELTGTDIRETTAGQVEIADRSRPTLSLVPDTGKSIEQRLDFAADAERANQAPGATAAEKGQATKRQGDLFKGPQPLTKEQSTTQSNLRISHAAQVAANLVKELDNGQAAAVSAQKAGQGNAKTTAVSKGQKALLSTENQNAIQGTISPKGKGVQSQKDGGSRAPAGAVGRAQEGRGAAPATKPVPTRQDEVAPVNAAPVAEVVAPSPPPVASAKAPVAAPKPTRKEVVVTPTGKAQEKQETTPGTSVPWGDFSRTVNSDGTVSYGTQKPPTMVSVSERMLAAAGVERFSKAKRQETVPDTAKRPFKGDDEDRYAFELYHYNTKLGPMEGTNNIWLKDYMQAMEDAIGVVRKMGTMTKKRLSPSSPRVQNARAALSWLHDYEGMYDWNKDELAQVRENILAVNTRAVEAYREILDSIKENVRYEFTRQELARRLKREPTVVEIERYEPTAAEEAMIEKVAKRDPGMMFMQSSRPNYDVQAHVIDAVSKGNLEYALRSIAENSESDWMRYAANMLRGIGLTTKIRMVNTVARDASGERVYGRYDHREGLMYIYLGGENPHTVIHETTHAATVGRITMAKAALKTPFASHTADEKAAVASLLDLRAFMGEMRKIGGSEQFSAAFRSEEEFVAEVMANERLQTWMKDKSYDNRSLWQKFVDWVRELFGASPYEGRNALEHALSVSFPWLDGSHFGAAMGLSFNHSATGAAAQTDSVVGTLINKVSTLATNSAKLGTLGDKIRAGLWQASTTFNIAQWVDKVESLKTMVPGMHSFMAADGTKTVLRNRKQLEFSNTVTTPLTLALSKLPGKQADAMNAKLMSHAFDMTTMGVEAWHDYDYNKRLNNVNLDAADKDYVNRRHAEYMAIPEQFRKPFEESFRVLRKNYIQDSALKLRDFLGIYVGTSPQLQPLISTLDIMNPALDKATPASEAAMKARPGFYFDHYSANLDRLVRNAMTEAAKVQTEDGHLKADVHDIAKFYFSAVDNPYMHLGRSGDYFLEYKVESQPGAWEAMQKAMEPFGKVINLPTTERHVFLRFEDSVDRDRAEAAIKGLGAAITTDSLRGGSLYQTDEIGRMQGVPRFIHQSIRKIDTNPNLSGDEKATMREFLKRTWIEALPDSSAQKAYAQRKSGGVPGADADFLRNFSKRAEGMTSMISNQYTMPLYDNSFDAMKTSVDALRTSDSKAADKANEVLNEMGRRFSNSLTPVNSPIIDATKAFGFNYFLAFSPAFWLTNMVQPYHLTLPFIGGRYGFVATGKEMGKSTAKAFKLIKAASSQGWAQGMAMGGTRGAIRGVLDLSLPVEQSGLTPGEMEFVRKLIDSGQLDTTQGHELGRIASGDSSRMTSVTKMLSIGSHYTEVLNRLTAGLTAYNMAMTRGKNMTADAAASYGINAVRETQFDYSDHNTARALGRHGIAGKVTPLLASFQQYTFQTMELLIRMVADIATPMPENATPEQRQAVLDERRAAMKGLGGVMATTSMLAGTLGLPLANAIAAVVDRVIGSGDDPYDVKEAYRSWLAGAVGKDVAEAIARGVPRAVLGFDTSGRMGLQDLLPGSRFLADRRDLKSKMESGAFNLLGPAVSAGTSTYVGMNKIMDGQLMDGLIDFLPLALKGPAKAVKMGETGYSTATGNTLPIEVTSWGMVSQAFGFTPSVKAEQSEVNFAFQQRMGQLQQRKALLSNKLYRAIEQGEDATAIMQDVMQFNMQNPQLRIDAGAGLALRAKERATAAGSDADIATLPRYLPMLNRYSYANIK